MRAATLEWECILSIPPPAGVGEQIVAFHATQQQIMYLFRFTRGRYPIVKDRLHRILRVLENGLFISD